MIEFIIYNKNSNEISQIIQDLKTKGILVGKDFDFEYSPGKYDWATVRKIDKQTKFTFYNEKLATWFVLRYS